MERYFFTLIGLREGHNFKIIDRCHWVFFKEKEIFYRITVMNNFSPDFPPALVAEITAKHGLVDKPHAEIVESVIRDLICLGIIDKEQQIAQTDVKLIDCTYPIPTVGLKSVKEKIKSKLEENNIFLAGRSGAWEYLNIDGVLQQVREFCEKKMSNAEGACA